MATDRRRLGAVAVVVAAVAVQLVSAFQALGGDDIYVLANVRSGAWSRRLFAFNLDTPAPAYMPWWTGQVLQRRFIRVPASALIWLESELFGSRAVPYHLVTLALLAASCLLLFLLLSRRMPLPTAAVVALVPALHPASVEIVGNLCCQPIATAGLLSVAAVAAWQRMRERPSAGSIGTVVLLCALAVTSYEAAVVLPVFLVLADVLLGPPEPSTSRRWGPR
ncbi:MAG TPA: hypothetical protein VIY73_02725, partial [Polyangiaceae bacterium]